jgi:3-oxoacyl-[acyl-carrier-protein] synthase-3
VSSSTPTRGIRITGWGTALPEKVVTNADLEGWLDTSDEWIRERTGISERRVGGTTADLAVEAGRRALESAGVTADDIDLVVLCTTSPDQQVPATSATVQSELGITGGAFDLNAACSGFVYGLVTAAGLAAVGADRILLIGAETLSRITDWDDRGTAILFADGGGAVVVEAVDGPGDLLGWDLGADGSSRHILFADIGGTFEMDGPEVFRQAVRAMVASSRAALEVAGVAAADLALVVPHQANRRIVESACNKLGVPYEKAAMVLETTGNTSAASIPLALADALDAGRVQDGDLVLLTGFGAGMTWASAVVRWST